MSPSDPELDRSGPGADLRRILDGLPDAVGVLQGTRAVFANRALLELAGVDGLDELNRSSLLRDGFSEVDRASLVEVISGVSDGPVEVCLRRVAGGSTSLEILAYPVGFKGEPARCFVARDQTAVKTIEAGLVHTDRLASIGSLAAGVAHEINNPLSFVMYGLPGGLWRPLRQADRAVRRRRGARDPRRVRRRCLRRPGRGAADPGAGGGPGQSPNPADRDRSAQPGARG
jgi:signal transduction histidine kinase